MWNIALCLKNGKGLILVFPNFKYCCNSLNSKMSDETHTVTSFQILIGSRTVHDFFDMIY